jgi:hypothetical protein
MSEREGSQRERGARRAAEERALSEREGSQRERGARRAARRAAPRGGAGMGIAPAGPAEERA